MTNLDNIRQMNSEELAEFMSKRMSCDHCIYNENKECRNATGTCADGIKAWLEQEITPTLSDDEKVILRNLDKKYKWIARDEDSNIFVYETFPHKRVLIWDNGINECNSNINPFNHLFQFIKWSDKEPYEISKLLGE